MAVVYLPAANVIHSSQWGQAESSGGWDGSTLAVKASTCLVNDWITHPPDQYLQPLVQGMPAVDLFLRSEAAHSALTWRLPSSLHFQLHYSCPLK